MNIAIIGAGAWGGACALHLARSQHTVYLNDTNTSYLNTLKKTRKSHFFPDQSFPSNVEMLNFEDAIAASEAILIAVPSEHFLSVISNLKDIEKPVAWLSKGFAPKPHYFLYQSFFEKLQKNGTLISGPSFAQEVANNHPTGLLCASIDTVQAKFWTNIFNYGFMRVYWSDDIAGASLGGAMKNVYAITTGIASGLGFGTNTQVLLQTRAIAELLTSAKVLQSLNIRKETLLGLSGIGDLMLTCSDDLSRNRRFGKLLGQGHNTQSAFDNLGLLVEGVGAAYRAFEIFQSADMPILKQTLQIIKGKSPKEAMADLLNRSIKQETV